MIKIVLDTCSLIYLAKINQLPILLKISDELYIDKEVFNESVVSGKKYGYGDAFILERFINDHIKVVPQDISKEIGYFGAKGEASTYLLGIDGLCVTSDSKAFKKMVFRGIKVIKIEDLLYLFVKNQKIVKKKFADILNALLKIEGISIEKYHLLMEELK
ncbi:MAG: hypothetical protein ACTSO9_21045 [Candidatus Helarchaeota archaeon]